MTYKSVRWSSKYIGDYTFLTFALLFIVLASVTIGISALIQDMDPDLLLLIVIVALSLSWLFARTKIPGWITGFVLIPFGALLTILLIGDLWGTLITWLQTIDDMLRQFLLGQGDFSTDPHIFWINLSELKLRSITLFAELGNWLRTLDAGNPVYNYFAISLVWGFSIWLVSIWAGWFQRRKEKPFVSILPAGLLLAVSLGYTYGATTALFPLIFGVLSLVALTFYKKRERSWIERSMDYPEEERAENILFIFGITLGFVFAAALVPQLPFKWVVETIREWVDPQAEQIDPILESFGLEGDNTPIGSVETLLSGGLPREHLIGSGPELSDQIVMTVQLDDNIEELYETELPLYWRGITYDRYTGYGWESSEVLLRTYKAEESVVLPDLLEGEAYRMLQQDYHFAEPKEIIYAAGKIISLDTDFKIAWRIVPGITETEKTSGDFFTGSQNNRTYHVDSMVPVVSEKELHAAQGQYPGWVIERYLALPDNISPRVIDLARDLTRNSPTSYGKVRSIEAYLRTYKYELNLPVPPINEELSDYFLFELKKGYCDYYATAMVVLSRAVGIPARFAIGYTHGSYDPDGGEFVVAEDNAHSWVEIYFIGIGWIPFEPTAAIEAIQRSQESLDLTDGIDKSTTAEVHDLLQTGIPNEWWYWLGRILFGAAMILLIWPNLDVLYLKWLTPSKMAAKLYKRIYHFGRRVGSPARVGDTPYEYAGILGLQIRTISQNSRWEPYLQPAQEDVQSLSHTYVRSIYSPHSLPQDEVEQTISSWRRLRIRLLLTRILFTWRHVVRH